MQLKRGASPAGSTRRFGWVGAAALAVVMPLFDAHAQPPAQLPPGKPPLVAPVDQPKTVKLPTEMNGRQTTLSDDDYEYRTYLVHKQTEDYPSYSVKGPARLYVEFYPFVDKGWFKTKDSYPRTVAYNLSTSGLGSSSGTAAKEIEHNGTTSPSDFTTDGTIIPKKGPLGIGTSITFTIELGIGEHTIRFLRPNGLVRIARAEQFVAPEKPKTKHDLKPIEPVRLPDQVTPVGQSEHPAPVADARYAFTSWTGADSRMASHQFGVAYRFGYIWLGGTGSLLGHSRSRTLPAGDLNATNTSWHAAGRLGFGNGSEHGFWRFAANVGRLHRNLNSTSPASVAKPASDSVVLVEGEFMSTAEFGKGGHVYTRLRFGNNPTAPGDAELHLTYPLLVDAHPATIHLAAQYFNVFDILTDAENAHVNEKGRLILVRADGKLPLFGVGPVALSLPVHARVPIENFGSGIHPAIGSGLGLDLLLGRWRLAAIGGVELPVGHWANIEPLVSISLSYQGSGTGGLSAGSVYSGPLWNADLRASK